MQSTHIPANRVHETLQKYILADGLPIVLDYEKSRGSTFVDKRTGDEYLDFFSFFASQPIGYNHPLTREPDHRARLQKVAQLKPSSSDVYTEEYASFMETFARLGMRDDFRYAFLVAGGALGVENALKAAFDWKVRKNLAAGRGEIGTRVLHFRHAFHGRSGYTLSLTNTADPRKYLYFPKFDWPRIEAPCRRFPETEATKKAVAEASEKAIAEVEAAFDETPHEIAAIITEPIQAEGGDRHLPIAFLKELRRICDEREAMLVYDEVQTGCGLTGTFWAWEQLGAKPDLLAFGKKTQVCGCLATDRIDEVAENVFHVSSRINSTWGGDVVDMVRSQRNLEIIEAENLLQNARDRGGELLTGLRDLAVQHAAVTNPRGRGLMCAIDLPDTRTRDAVRRAAFERKLLILPCGKRSLRTRPFLNVTKEDIGTFLAILDDAIAVQ